MTKFKAGDKAFIVENNRYVVEVTVIKIAAGFATIRFAKGAGGTRVRESRLYATQADAEKSISGGEIKRTGGHWE